MKIKKLAEIVGGNCCQDCLNKEATMIVVVYADNMWEAFAACHSFTGAGWRREEHYEITTDLLSALRLVFPPRPAGVGSPDRVAVDSNHIHTVRGKQAAEFIREYMRKKQT